MGPHVMSLRVDSEIGPLKRVLVHRPGREIDWMVPQLMERLLFDDILYGDEARAEHDDFCDVLRRGGVEVLYAQDLLAETLEEPAVREALLAEMGRDFGLDAEVLQRLGDMAPAPLGLALVEGLRKEDDERLGSRRRDLFYLPPIPNFFFQRDPQAVIGDRVVISSMATEAREREPLLSRTIFCRHPLLAGAGLFEVDRPASGTPEHDPTAPYPTLEGGDVVVADRETLLVGISERTNRRGVELLAEHLRREQTPFRHLILVELPPRRSYMHLDTVFTFIDRGTCLAYLPVIEAGSAESARVYRVDLEAAALAFRVGESLLDALAEVGLDLEVVPCGGPDDLIVQQREQWTDGANAVALAPGVIVLYRRNKRTIEELARRGWRVLSEDDVVRGDAPVLGQGPTVITLSGFELSRARGGPRCMAMPLERLEPS